MELDEKIPYVFVKGKKIPRDCMLEIAPSAILDLQLENPKDGLVNQEKSKV